MGKASTRCERQTLQQKLASKLQLDSDIDESSKQEEDE